MSLISVNVENRQKKRYSVIGVGGIGVVACSGRKRHRALWECLRLSSEAGHFALGLFGEMSIPSCSLKCEG